MVDAKKFLKPLIQTLILQHYHPDLFQSQIRGINKKIRKNLNNFRNGLLSGIRMGVGI